MLSPSFPFSLQVPLDAAQEMRMLSHGSTCFKQSMRGMADCSDAERISCVAMEKPRAPWHIFIPSTSWNQDREEDDQDTLFFVDTGGVPCQDGRLCGSIDFAYLTKNIFFYDFSVPRWSLQSGVDSNEA